MSLLFDMVYKRYLKLNMNAKYIMYHLSKTIIFFLYILVNVTIVDGEQNEQIYHVDTYTDGKWGLEDICRVYSNLIFWLIVWWMDGPLNIFVLEYNVKWLKSR